MEKIYKVTLTPEERQELIELVSTGKSNAQKIKHAHILLAVDEAENASLTDREAAISLPCQYRCALRERFVEEGFEAALERKKSRYFARINNCRHSRQPWKQFKFYDHIHKPHLKKYRVIPPEQDGDFVAAMEDVLDVYECPYDPKRPVAGMAEQPNQLTGKSFCDSRRAGSGPTCGLLYWREKMHNASTAAGCAEIRNFRKTGCFIHF
ncbi:MAG: hypothetical protein FWC50_10700, partial [Planctomycetaceae bacterium]|nr:hypothetical protein [Planctomycetaceae bacterium]